MLTHWMMLSATSWVVRELMKALMKEKTRPKPKSKALTKSTKNLITETKSKTKIYCQFFKNSQQKQIQ